MKVKNLVPLFRPLALTAHTSDGRLLSGATTTHSFPPQIMEKRFQQQPRVQGVSSLQLLNTRSKLAVEPNLDYQYQPPIHHSHVTHQQAFLTYNPDSYHPTDAHVLYLNQTPSSSVQDPYAR